MSGTRETAEDASHLRALAIAHYCVGGFASVIACFPLIHAGIGFSLLAGVGGMGESLGGHSSGGLQGHSVVGGLFFVVGLLSFLIGEAIAVAVIISGRFLRQRRHYLFSFVLACVLCAFFPIGTALGVFTVIVLSRDSVKGAYAATPAYVRPR